MKSKIGNIIRDLEGKVGKPELLTIYAEEFMRLHHRYASMKMMMEYYMFYEMVSEGINPYISSAEDSAETFHGLLSRYLEGPSDEELQQMAEKLLSLRGEIVDKMQVLTAYVDCFVVYEYILNRVQYRFDDMELMPGDGVFAQDLVNFIFSSEDNTVISDKIRFAVGQLPMRMTRQHYFDLVRDRKATTKNAAFLSPATRARKHIKKNTGIPVHQTRGLPKELIPCFSVSLTWPEKYQIGRFIIGHSYHLEEKSWGSLSPLW